MAELWGFREGLLIAKNHGFTKVVAEADSEAMIHALVKESDSSPHANTLIADCKQIMEHFQVVKILHVF